MAISHIKSISIVGLDGLGVDIEVDLGLGLPNFVMVGLPDKSIEEAKERVRSALKNCHIAFPQHRVTVNLAPADIKKTGSCYDLPIAVGIAAGIEEWPTSALEGSIILGELSLGGDVKPVPGIFPAALFAASSGYKKIFVPAENANEATLVDGIEVYSVNNLKELYWHFREEKLLKPLEHKEYQPNSLGDFNVDLAQIKGQTQAKRALEIAAAGGHNMLMIGPPGSGKTLLAKAFAGILPQMTKEEVFDVTKIYSVAGLLSSHHPLVTERPFRSPHHTASLISLIGGGQWPRPGEISLAHRGVLFMDELPEFPRSLLESLRQPLEDGVVMISRAAGSLSFPSKFVLLATQNPCPCGYLNDSTKRCRCTPHEISRYGRKLSGPLLDRIDLHVAVPRVEIDELKGESKAESSKLVRERVQNARIIQHDRFKGSGFTCNAEMGLKGIDKFCRLDNDTSNVLHAATERLGLSARSYHRILKMARTIADLGQNQEITALHIAEALQFRESGYSPM